MQSGSRVFFWVLAHPAAGIGYIAAGHTAEVDNQAGCKPAVVPAVVAVVSGQVWGLRPAERRNWGNKRLAYLQKYRSSGKTSGSHPFFLWIFAM